MQQVSPATTLRIVYLIQDHTDSNTYYVRSVVKDSVSGAVLQTINLTDTGDRRFFGSYNVPPTEDVYFDITTTVYSDSGYTTKAQDKYEEIQQYLTKTQWGLQFQNLGGGAVAPVEKIDYKLIKKMVKDALKEEEKKEVDKYDDTTIREKLIYIEKCVGEMLVKKIEFPQFPDIPKPTDITPTLEAIAKIKIPVFNYAILLKAIDDLKSEIEKRKENKPQDIAIEIEKIINKPKEEKPIRVLGGYKMAINKDRIRNLMR